MNVYKSYRCSDADKPQDIPVQVDGSFSHVQIRYLCHKRVQALREAHSKRRRVQRDLHGGSGGGFRDGQAAGEDGSEWFYGKESLKRKGTHPNVRAFMNVDHKPSIQPGAASWMRFKPSPGPARSEHEEIRHAGATMVTERGLNGGQE